MRMTIIKPDGVLGVDGDFRVVDVSALPADVHAIQWDGADGVVEYINGKRLTKFSNLTDYQPLIDAWMAAEPKLTLDEEKVERLQKFRDEGLLKIKAQVSEWDTIDTIKTVAGLWNIIGPSASPAQIKARDIYVWVRNTATPKVMAAADKAALDAMDPLLPDPFRDGTLWP